MLLQSMAKLWIDYSAFIISTQIKSIFFFFLLFFLVSLWFPLIKKKQLWIIGSLFCFDKAAIAFLWVFLYPRMQSCHSLIDLPSLRPYSISDSMPVNWRSVKIYFIKAGLQFRPKFNQQRAIHEGMFPHITLPELTRPKCKLLYNFS